MTEEIKKYKLYFLQLKYNKIIDILNEFEEHYNILIVNNLIENQHNFSNMLYDIIKNQSNIYNRMITECISVLLLYKEFLLTKNIKKYINDMFDLIANKIFRIHKSNLDNKTNKIIVMY